MKKRSGFTLIELLIVIGIIAILAGIVIIAVNPTKQFAEANNAQRQSDVNALLNAVSQYAVDNRGQLPAFVNANVDPIVSTGTGTTAADLCNALVPTYISGLPTDPVGSNASATTPGTYTDCGTAFDLGYSIGLDANSRIEVTAPHAEDGATITITR